jgi:hypothetical protein
VSRHRPPHIAQGTWRRGALDVWGWNGIDTAPTAWLYSGFRRVGADGRRSGWHDSPISYGVVGRITIELADHPTLYAASAQLDPLGTAVWLSALPASDQLSDSLAWFARIAELARRTVSSGRIVPAIEASGPFTVARWRPLVTDDVAEVLDRAARAMPPICTAASSATVPEIYDRLVDGIARGFLQQAGWKPDLGRQRKPEVQALRATFGALAKTDDVVRGSTAEFAAAVDRLRDELERHRHRTGGEPVVVPRIRLVISEDPLDDWEVRIELVDDRDSQRWCTAADVWDRNHLAVDVARAARHLGVLVDVVSATVDRVATLPGLADLANEHEPSAIELDLATAEDFLDIAPHALRELGIELVGPERLVRAGVEVTGTATPAPPDDRRSRFSKEALVEWTMHVDGETLTETELERAALAGSTLLHTGHRWVRIDPDELRRKRARLTELRAERSRVTPIELLRLAADDGGDGQYGGTGGTGGTGGATVHVVEAGAADPDGAPAGTLDGDGLPEDVTGGRSADDWVRELLAGLPDDRLDEMEESPEFTGELRHYQRRGLAWMQLLARLGLGGCLADDMGLGKTATTLAHLLERPGPHLVVCPLSVVRNWRTEAHRFAPKLDVRIHHGSGRFQLDDPDAVLFSSDPERRVVVTTYGLLPRDLEHLADVDWSTVVLDEAQMVKNPHTKAARAVRRLRADQKLALTGTPVENRLSELWAILDAVNPGMLGGLQRFRERFGTPIERRGDADAAARLRRLTGPFVLRRTKADRRLLPDLPDKIEQIAYAKLTREQATMYQQVVDQLLVDAEQSTGMRRRGLVLAALTRLKQICNHPAHALRDGSRLAGRSGKLTRFDELVTDLLDQEERALVFTQFAEMGHLLKAHLAEQFALDVAFLHGGVARGGRDRMVDSFQDDTGAPLMVVSLKAGGTGLNLTAASQVIHYDRWWNPAVEDQATDRAWRIGQRRTVNVHKLVCEGTVEERIGEVIDDKRALADTVVGTSEAWVSELSTDELRDLIALEVDP